MIVALAIPPPSPIICALALTTSEALRHSKAGQDSKPGRDLSQVTRRPDCNRAAIEFVESGKYE